jgi:hypothetical protein
VLAKLETSPALRVYQVRDLAVHGAWSRTARSTAA